MKCPPKQLVTAERAKLDHQGLTTARWDNGLLGTIGERLITSPAVVAAMADVPYKRSVIGPNNVP